MHRRPPDWLRGHRTPEYGEIKRIHVRPSARGQGVARRLMYERMGYQRCGPFAEYPEDRFSVFMQKDAE